MKMTISVEELWIAKSNSKFVHFQMLKVYLKRARQNRSSGWTRPRSLVMGDNNYVTVHNTQILTILNDIHSVRVHKPRRRMSTHRQNSACPVILLLLICSVLRSIRSWSAVCSPSSNSVNNSQWTGNFIPFSRSGDGHDWNVAWPIPFSPCGWVSMSVFVSSFHSRIDVVWQVDWVDDWTPNVFVDLVSHRQILDNVHCF